MTRDVGFKVEKLAENYLIDQGLKTISKNFNCRLGEIDLIMQENACLVFVEVRYRKSLNYGHALETIDRNKQKKLTRAANYFLQSNACWQNKESRFDVVTLMATEHKFDWVKNAFEVENFLS